LCRDLYRWHGNDDVSATTKAILVLARVLAVITEKGSQQIDHKEVGAGGKQQRKGREDENALTAHVPIISQDTNDAETDISPTPTAFTTTAQAKLERRTTRAIAGSKYCEAVL